jgi:hypothetical protein
MKAEIARKMIFPIISPMRSSVDGSGGLGLLITSLCIKASAPAMSLLLTKDQDEARRSLLANWGVYLKIEVDEQRVVNVRFTPESGHPSAQTKCPLWANC